VVAQVAAGTRTRRCAAAPDRPKKVTANLRRDGEVVGRGREMFIDATGVGGARPPI
jgi:hypothetical protein